MDNEITGVIFSMSAFTDERSIIIKMSTLSKIVLWLAINVSLLVGWFSKGLIYTHIFKTNIREQPINILILIEQLIHHFCGNFVLVNFSTSLLFGLSTKELAEAVFGEHINGNTYCSILGYVQVYGAIYAEGNGLSTAIVRILYMKKGTWLKCKYGEFRLIKRVAVANILIGIFLTFLYEIENISNRSVNNICKGHSQGFEVKSFLSLLPEYKLIIPHH